MCEVNGKVRFFYRITRFSFWLYFKLFHRLSVYGAGHTSKGGGIIAPNHASFYDPPLIAATCSEEIHFLARKSLFKSLFGKLISCLNAHPISGEASSITVIKETCALLKSGKKVVIFPEGVRSYSGGLEEIKSGVSMIALRSNRHIIPAYISGSYSVWNRQHKIPKLWGKLAVVYGTPIELDSFATTSKKEKQERVTKEIEKRIVELKTWYDSGCDGSPP